MSQTLSLYRLQQIDSQIDRLQFRLQAVQKLLDDDAEIQQLRMQFKDSDAHVSSCEKQLQKAETDVQNQQIKIEQTQSSLYGGKSHSPKELQDLQNDLASLKRFLVVLEDRQLDAMQESETAVNDRRLAQERLESASAARAEKCKDLRVEQEILASDLEKSSKERIAVSEAIPQVDLNLYDQLRQQRRGVAVAIIKDNSCGACGSSLSLAQIQSIRSSAQIIRCPSCDRILYAI